MSTEPVIGRPAVNALRTALGIGGVLAAVVGVLILLWPGKTLSFVTVIIAIYAIAAGLVYAGLGIFSTVRGGWSRVGHIVLGVLFVIAGVVALFNITLTRDWLLLFVGVLVGIMWIIEGVVSLSTLETGRSRPWTVVFAVLSIVAGIVILFAPVWGTLVLWWLLGISLLVLGVMNIVRAFTFGSRTI